MIRWILLFFIFTFNKSLSAKEWKNLKTYQKATQKQTLTSSDWLKCDRTRNTLTWQQANIYNLNNNLPKEYEIIVQHKDFYEWLYKEVEKKGHDVIWINMAHFISKKIHVMEAFPYSLFTRKKIRTYANQGSEAVFNNAFSELKKLYNSQTILKANNAVEWDEVILEEEQYDWIEGIYKAMDAKSLKTLERIAKGKFIYGLVVPKSIKFKGQLESAKSRYNYALEVLKPYCENRYKS